jgi:cysteine synthase
MKTYNNISEAVGHTPLVKINRLVTADSATVLTKLEFYNPTSSVKDRIAVSMIDAAEKAGLLAENGVIIEPTSGNTGLGLAMVAAARGYELIITMPESMSLERRALMRHMGAEIILTPAEEGMTGAIEKAEKILQETPGAFMPQQFNNPANPEIHHETTGREIWDDTDGNVDIFVAGVGTGGTLTGVGTFLKEQDPTIKIVAIEPETSAVLSGDHPGKHGIQGIGAGFIPEILQQQLIDEIIKVSDEDAIHYARLASSKEGILCGISSGAAIAAAIKLAERSENQGKTIVTILPDTAERYITAGLFYKLGG